MMNLLLFALCTFPLSSVQFTSSKPLTHTAEHGPGVHRGAAGPGRDFG